MTEANIVLSPISQVGIVVKDAEKTAEHYYSTFGIGPFAVQDVDMPRGTILYGNPATGKLRIALAQMGSIEIELIQVLESGEFYAEFLRDKGEGLHHLGIDIDDSDTYDRLLTQLASQGIKPVLSYRGRRMGFAYLDTRAVGGAVLELIHREKGE